MASAMKYEAFIDKTEDKIMNENTAKLRTTAGEAQKDVKTTVTDGTLFSSDAARPNNNIIVLACSGRGKPRSAVTETK